MSSGAPADRGEILATYADWEAANQKVVELSLDALTHTELLDLQHRREVVARSLPAVDHQIITRLAAEADPKAPGGTNLPDVLSTRLRKKAHRGPALPRPEQASGLSWTANCVAREGPWLHPSRLHRSGRLVSSPPRRRLGHGRRGHRRHQPHPGVRPDNRLVEEGGWLTRKREDGRIDKKHCQNNI
jgi:hypothetical protein